MTTLSAHTTRAIHNKGMQAVYGIAAEYNVDAADVIALLGTTSHTSITGHHSPFVRLEATTQSQPESTSHAPAADTPAVPPAGAPDGAAVPSLSAAPSVTIKPPHGLLSTAPKVSATHVEHPDWPAKLIAEHLGITKAAARSAAAREGIVLVSWWEYQRAQASATTEALRTAVEPPEAATVEPKPETPPPAIPDAPIEPPEPVDRVALVRECHEANPDWQVKQIAEAIGLSWRVVDALAARHKIEVPRPIAPQEAKPAKPAKPATLADKIRAHVAEHPDATLAQVSEAIGGNMKAVGWAALKAGIVLRKRNAQERSEASARGRARLPETLTPPDESSIQPDETVMSAPQAVHQYRPAPLTTARFYLRDGAGKQRWVHQSLDPSPTGPGPLMTEQRAYAWFPNGMQYRAALKRWPELSSMRKEGRVK